MKRYHIAIILIVAFASLCIYTLFLEANPKTIRPENKKNQKVILEKIPTDLKIKILKEKTNEVLEKNEITIELSRKITKNELSLLADSIYTLKPYQRRFYMFYYVKGIEDRTVAWATTHYDPNKNVVIYDELFNK